MTFDDTITRISDLHITIELWLICIFIINFLVVDH